jgi:hypothetical protein
MIEYLFISAEMKCHECGETHIYSQKSYRPDAKNTIKNLFLDAGYEYMEPQS